MATVRGLKEELQNKISVIFKKVNLFFAFNQEQFEEGKAANPIGEGETYIRVAGGGILPKKNLITYKKKMSAAIQWYEDTIKENNLKEEEILYELRNHEAFYTGDIEDTCDLFEGRYTTEEIQTIFNKHYEAEVQS